MWLWIDSAAGYIAANPTEALCVAFLAAVIEAVAILGVMVPGTGILMAIAGAAAVAGQSMLPFLAVAIGGAIIGDVLSFWFGARYRSHLSSIWPFSRRPALMNNAVRFFQRYGVASVAICRFVPVLRSTVPMVAGMAGMETKRFLVANITSAFLWAPLHIYPAQVAGLSIDRLRAGDWQNAALWGLLLAACAVLIWGLHRLAVSRAR